MCTEQRLYPPLSRYGRAAAVPSPVSRMMAQFAAEFRTELDINLGVGYVNENTIPRQRILEALDYVLAHPQKHRLALNYGGPEGSANLIAALRRFHLEQGVGGLDAATLDRQRIIIGPNGATSLLEGIAQVIEPGIVVTSDPIYYIYCHYLERLGFEICAIPEDGQGLDPQSVEQWLARLGPRLGEVRFFYVVTIGNPTSTILSNRRRQGLAEVAARLSRRLNRQVPLILDKAYENLVHDPAVPRPLSALLYDEAGVVYEIGTLSKILAPALRIGYMIGRDGPLLRAMVQKTSDAGFSAPLVTQEIAAYLLDHYAAEQLARVNTGYRAKALRCRQWIDDCLGKWLADCRGGQAGFYFYLTFRDLETHEQAPFFRFLSRATGCPEIDGPPSALNPRVLYLPGEFCVHRQGQMVAAGRRQLRISYGFEELPRIERALVLMQEAAAWAERR